MLFEKIDGLLMTSSSHDCSYALLIPTYKRPHYLKLLLANIVNQQLVPTVVIVCDSSPDDVHDDVTTVCNQSPIPVQLIRSSRASTPTQRNLLIDYLNKYHPTIRLVLFLDDDTEPETDYALKLAQFISNRGFVDGGVSGMTPVVGHINSRIVNMVDRFFLLGGPTSKVLTSGVNTPPCYANQSYYKADWLFGCGTMWNRSIFSTFYFPTDWKGYAMAEDAYFSYQVSEQWNLWVIPSAMIKNAEATEGRPDLRTFSSMKIVSRWKIRNIYRGNRILSFFSFWWSVVGSLGVTVFHLATRKSHSKDEWFGYVNGIREILRRGQLDQN